jgi:hypothetical protein
VDELFVGIEKSEFSKTPVRVKDTVESEGYSIERGFVVINFAFPKVIHPKLLVLKTPCNTLSLSFHFLKKIEKCFGSIIVGKGIGRNCRESQE